MNEHEWIKTKDRNPRAGIDGIVDDLDDVLICYKIYCDRCCNYSSDLYLGIGYLINKEWHIKEPLDYDVLPTNIDVLITVLYWMPLPKPPELPK